MSSGPLTIALTGATGFVGRQVLAHLLEAGHRPRVLLRHVHRDLDLEIPDDRLERIYGSLDDPVALDQFVQSVDAVIHLVGIIAQRPRRGQTFHRVHTQGTQALVAAAQRACVPRFVHMSALGARADADSRYHLTKYAAEQAVQQSSMDWTIFRPSIIHGPDGEFMQMIKRLCVHRLPPFMPYFGRGFLGLDGAGQLQPIWVQDVARCFAAAVTLPVTVNQIYPLGGPDVFNWPQLYDVCQTYLLPAAGLPPSRRKKPLAVPAWLAKGLAVLPGVPFNKDQVIMSQEDSICPIEKAQADFGFQFAAFEPIFARYAHQIGD